MSTSRVAFSLFLLTLFLIQNSCTSARAQNGEKYRKTVRFPFALREASGLAIKNDNWFLHNDSGDGPYLYQTDSRGKLQRTDTLRAGASDYEDLTTDLEGNFYLGDFGNNRGLRKEMQVYRYNPTRKKTDTIAFHYPGQDGRGRDQPGNHNCEAMVYHAGFLHLFTKDLIGRKSNYYTYHFRVPAVPGSYEAVLVDSLYLPGRVVTAAALDAEARQLVLTAYTFNLSLGFFPNGAASLITISDYPEDHFLAGKVKRENLSWGVPTQFEAVDFLDDHWLYVVSEATAIRPFAVAKLKRRLKPPKGRTKQ